MKIDICFSPVLYPHYKKDEDTVVVVVDVFRATTCMCVALANGAKSIIPVATSEEALFYHKKGYLVGGEKNMVKFDFGDFGNSPNEYTRERVEGKEIVISTTNGTHAIDMASGANKLLIGSFSNLSVIANFCISQKKNVLVVCAGWKDRFNIEDTLFGGALAEILEERGGYDTNFDAVSIALSMWKEAKRNTIAYVNRSEHMRRLASHDLLDVVAFCLEADTVNVLPVYSKKAGKIVAQEYNRSL